jgi:hypothetical protein
VHRQKREKSKELCKKEPRQFVEWQHSRRKTGEIAPAGRCTKRARTAPLFGAAVVWNRSCGITRLLKLSLASPQGGKVEQQYPHIICPTV